MYEIKNSINGKIYVGVHKTRVEDDGYMGSGKVIKRAIEKHGIENFTKTIIERFDSQEAMFAREKEVVNEEFLARDDTYNLRRGGYGGFDHVNKNVTKEVRQKIALSSVHKRLVSDDIDPSRKIKRSEKLRLVAVERLLVGSLNPISEENRMMGVRAAMSEESATKRKRTFQQNSHSVGQKNSQFGSMWITNGSENKKIKKEGPIPEGWERGRFCDCGLTG